MNTFQIEKCLSEWTGQRDILATYQCCKVREGLMYKNKTKDLIGTSCLAKMFELLLHDRTLLRYGKPVNCFNKEAKTNWLSSHSIFIIY